MKISHLYWPVTFFSTAFGAGIFFLPQAVGPGVLGMKVFMLFIVIAMSVSMMAHYLFQIHHFAPGERFPGGIIDIYRRAGSGNRLCAVYFVDDYYRADKFHHLGQRRRVFFPQRILGQGRHFAVAECRAVGGMVGV